MRKGGAFVTHCYYTAEREWGRVNAWRYRNVTMGSGSLHCQLVSILKKPPRDTQDPWNHSPSPLRRGKLADTRHHAQPKSPITALIPHGWMYSCYSGQPRRNRRFAHSMFRASARNICMLMREWSIFYVARIIRRQDVINVHRLFVKIE